MHGTLNTASNAPRRPISPCLAPPQPLAKKRGWVPSSSEMSVPAAVETSTNGYLDTPAKYRDQARTADDDLEEMVAGKPSAHSLFYSLAKLRAYTFWGPYMRPFVSSAKVKYVGRCLRLVFFLAVHIELSSLRDTSCKSHI